MYAILLAVAMGPTPAERRGIEGVKWSDVTAFKFHKEEVRKNFLSAVCPTDELRYMIHQNNPPEVVDAWENDWQYRRKCWDLLDDAIYCEYMPEARRLRSLGRLREMLGDDDYFAGRMPCPKPFYRK
jgi:hypothetical protein